MAIRVAINGFGRIGRLTFRNLHKRSREFEVVAINDLTDPAGLAHLLKYDSIFGRFPGTVASAEGYLDVDGRRVKVIAEKDPAKLPWKDLAIDFAVESAPADTATTTGPLAGGCRRMESSDAAI